LIAIRARDPALITRARSDHQWTKVLDSWFPSIVFFCSGHSRRRFPYCLSMSDLAQRVAADEPRLLPPVVTVAGIRQSRKVRHRIRMPAI
jgi:hypothetical protein